MRRLLVMTVLAGAALGLSVPAHASVKCTGRSAAGYNVGVCAGSSCPDVCFIVVDPYCYRDARTAAADWCAIVDSIG